MKKTLIVLAVSVVLLFVVFSILTSYYTDYLWYQSMEATEVFLKPFLAELLIKGVLLIAGFTFIVVNILPMISILEIPAIRIVQNGEEQSQQSFKFSKKHGIILSLVLGLIWVGALPSIWDKVYLWLNSSTTGVVDPIFGWDESFYLFTYPLLSTISGSFITLLILTALPLAAGYFMLMNSNLYHKKAQAMKYAKTQGAIFLALFFVWFALTRYLGMASLLLSEGSRFYGAGYTDVHARLPLIRIQQVIALILAIVSLVNIRYKQLKLTAGTAILLVLVMVGSGIYSAVIQNFVVNPNESQRESQYMTNHIEATRRAYGLENIKQKEYPISNEGITVDKLQQNQQTINNIRLLDYRPLRQHYQQNQSLGLFYEFVDVDIDRYMIDGEYRQVMLALRELNIKSLADEAQTAVNHHFRYTNGYGVVMSPVNQITSNGHPTYFMRDMPVNSSVDITLERPEIYFGELTNQFVVVNSNYDGVEPYHGEDGVELNLLRRLLYANKFNSSILLLSGEITPDSRIMYHRNIVDRIQKIAPFIELDNDPYPVVANGRIYWIVDGYTTASTYPYSRPTRNYNYIRNSVKFVVDAYDGTVDIYQFDDNDPIIEAWKGVFPDLIKDRNQFPEYLKAHIRYPVDYFNVQSEILRTYHTTNPAEFYNRNDVWEIAVERYNSSEVQVEPYYVTMQLPEGEEQEFILKLPYTPMNRNNMVAWLTARNDGENYGELVLYQFPRGQAVAGPSQVEAYIDQDSQISGQLTLWGQGGSTVIRGNLLTIPINGSMLYVEPLYISSENRSVPELRQVIVYYNDVLVMEPTLEAALTRIFGEGSIEAPELPEPIDPVDPTDPTDPTDPIDPTDPGTIEDPNLRKLVEDINTAFENMERAQREGRWADYGRYLEEVKDLISRLDGNTN
ncbi:UPF0182 family protein [Alkalicella caledoniensis]|uniref:UPF0182 protein HYG86_12895 n=1 Tax=Alkalicella caledoniensis TaxID=2731377 RepID=A0A7G9WA93_ALKCA|nr:UPF0182 family protein [Alkalicella caledoniensis]QNO15605.1 UPF0182 family protein [Alkalicella caledoniensis]